MLKASLKTLLSDRSPVIRPSGDGPDFKDLFVAVDGILGDLVADLLPGRYVPG